MNYKQYLEYLPVQFFDFSNDTLNKINTIVFSEDSTRAQKMDELDEYSQIRRNELNLLILKLDKMITEDDVEEKDVQALAFLRRAMVEGLLKFLQPHFDKAFDYINNKI